MPHQMYPMPMYPMGPQSQPPFAPGPAQVQEIPPAALPINLPNDKEALGEKLYPLVEAKNPQMASKITGMLLEMEIEQIQNIIRDSNQLSKWIEEAVKVYIIFT